MIMARRQGSCRHMTGPSSMTQYPNAQVVLQDLTALLRGQGRVEPYQPHGVRLVEFGDGFP